MPKRSNFFQRLIFVIEQSMVDVPGTTVRESVLLGDQRTGEEREVDILIESVISRYPVRIAIECRNYRRKCDVTWIEQLVSKYADLLVDKVVAVSRRGFSGPAEEKARQHGIETLSLRSALDTNWDKMLSESALENGMGYWDIHWLQVGFRHADPAKVGDIEYHDEEEASDFWICDLRQKRSWHLPDFERILEQNDEIQRQMQAFASKVIDEFSNDTTHYSVSRNAMLSFESDYLLADGAGWEWPVDQVVIEFEVRVGRSRREVFEYRDQRVMVDTLELDGEIMDDPTGWVTVQPKDAPREGRVMTSYSVSNGEFGHFQLCLDVKEDNLE